MQEIPEEHRNERHTGLVTVWIYRKNLDERIFRSVS